jgi:hypothetical protein
MAIRTKRTIGLASLALLALVASVTSFAIASRFKPTKTSTLAAHGPQLLLRAENPARQEEINATQRTPYISYREITSIEDHGNDGGMALIVEVECWHGAEFFPKIPTLERANRLKVSVYDPSDLDRHGNPVTVAYSDKAEAEVGLYKERVPFEIPLPASVKPYHVTVELVSAQPVPVLSPGKTEGVAVERGFCGKSFEYLVR